MTICNRPNDPEDLPPKDEQPNTADKAAAGAGRLEMRS